MTVNFAARRFLTRIGIALLLPLTAVACGGAPGSERLRDSAANGVPSTVADAGGESHALTTAPPGTCWDEDQGCHCMDWGATVACKGPVIRDGQFTTCTGMRQCVRGVWGPCLPPTYVSAHSH